MRPKKKVPNYAKQKAAFDQVLETYRSSRSQLSGLGCVNPAKQGGGGGTIDKAKPSLSDFRCDVERIVKTLVASKYLQLFWATYKTYDSENDLEREKFAQRMLGDRRHSWEQRLGAKFIELGLYPSALYLRHERRQCENPL